MINDNYVYSESLSKWYGEILGIQNVSLSFSPGLTAVVGPNGSGKSTLFRLFTGQIRPNEGAVSLWGKNPWHDRSILRRVGFAPEGEALPARETARRWVERLAVLSGVPVAEAPDRVDATLRTVNLEPADRERPLEECSNGMRQKAKLAQAIVHDPDVLILDEPFSGVDPVSRADIADALRRLGRRGKTVVLSSHSLEDVSRLTDRIALIHRGRLLATGRVPEIRRLLDRYPYRVRIACDDPRRLAVYLAPCRETSGLLFAPDGDLVVETFDFDGFASRLADVVAASDVSVGAFFPEDERLESVFTYLTSPRAEKGIRP